MGNVDIGRVEIWRAIFEVALRVVFVGRNQSGSWQIRGHQVASAMSAATVVRPQRTLRQTFDLAILVKRPDEEILRAIRGMPVIWDVVDAWPQPLGNDWDREAAMAWLARQLREIKPLAAIGATEAMASDLRELGCESICVPHHGREGQELNPIRDHVHTVGYEGGLPHLGEWRLIIEKHCAQRGWRFVVNPEVLSDVDIVLGLRWSKGYPARHWKSNVKLANAQITGTPGIFSPESGYLETQSGAECWAEDERGLINSFDRLEDYAVRSDASRIMQRAAPHLSQIVGNYATWLQRLKF